MKAKGFIYGSILMVIINFIVRSIDFAYDVMLSKYIGAEGLGLFHMASSVLMIFIVISSAGIPTAISRLIAEYKSKKDFNAIKKVLIVALMLSLIFGITFSTVIGFFGDDIAIKIYKNENMTTLIYFLIPAVILLPFAITLKGYYYGLRIITIPNISQIIEHIAQFIIVYALLILAYPMEPIKGALIAVCGISIGEVFNLIWLTAMLKKTNSKVPHMPYKRKSPLTIFKQIISISAPIAVADLLSVIFRFANSIFIPRRLIEIGYTSSEAISTLGRISGMTMPLIAIPFIVTGATAINLVPNISENMTLKRYYIVKRDINFSIKVALLAAIPLTLIYLTYPQQLGYYIYGDLKVSYFIRTMSFGTIFMSLEHTYSAILNGLKKQIAATRNRLIGLGIQVLCIYSLIGNPRFGINGFFIGYFLSGIIILVLDEITTKKIIKLKIDFKDILLKPIFASLVMNIIIYYVMNILKGSNFKDSIQFFVSLGIGSISYIIMLIITKAIPKNIIGKLREREN